MGEEDPPACAGRSDQTCVVLLSPDGSRGVPCDHARVFVRALRLCVNDGTALLAQGALLVCGGDRPAGAGGSVNQCLVATIS